MAITGAIAGMEIPAATITQMAHVIQSVEATVTAPHGRVYDEIVLDLRIDAKLFREDVFTPIQLAFDFKGMPRAILKLGVELEII